MARVRGGGGVGVRVRVGVRVGAGAECKVHLRGLCALREATRAARCCSKIRSATICALSNHFRFTLGGFSIEAPTLVSGEC